MSEILETLKFFGASYVATLGIAALCSYLGLFTVLRRIVFTGVALAQLAAAGVALSFFVADAAWVGNSIRAFARQYGAAAGSLGLSLAGAFGLQVRPHRHRSSPDALVGLVYTAAAASAVLLVWRSSSGLVELKNILAGEVLLSPTSELFLLWFGIIAVAVVHLVYRRQFLLCSFDPEFARVLGLPERRYQLMLLGTLAVAVALALRAGGLLLVFAFLVVPPLTGLALGKRLGDSTRIAVAASLASALIGFVLAIQQNLPVAPTISVVMIAWLLIAKVAAMHAALTRVAVGGIYGTAILAVAVGFLVFPWPNLDESQASERSGHGHGDAHAGGPSSGEIRANAQATLAGSSDADERLQALTTLRRPNMQVLDSIRPMLSALQDDDERVAASAREGLDELSKLFRAKPMLQAIASKYEEPEAAFSAARFQVSLGIRVGLGHMVALLGHPDFPLLERETLLEELKIATGGEDFGYDGFSEPDENFESLERWKAWWKKNGESGLIWDKAQRRFLPGNA